MKSYVEANLLKSFAVADEADNNQVWQQLAEATSRLFDTACDVEAEFFSKSSGNASEKTFQMNGTAYLKLFPYLPGTIASVKKVSTFPDETLTTDFYYERDGYLIFYGSQLGIEPTIYNLRSKIKVRAKFGFADTPADIRQAVIEQALMMWRRKDLAFAELSGVSTAVAQATYSPTFQAVADKYRGLYSSVAIG